MFPQIDATTFGTTGDLLLRNLPKRRATTTLQRELAIRQAAKRFRLNKANAGRNCSSSKTSLSQEGECEEEKEDTKLKSDNDANLDENGKEIAAAEIEVRDSANQLPKDAFKVPLTPLEGCVESCLDVFVITLFNYIFVS